MESQKPGARATGAVSGLAWFWILETEEAGVAGKVPGARGVMKSKGSVVDGLRGVVVFAVFGVAAVVVGILAASVRMVLSLVASSVSASRVEVMSVTLKDGISIWLRAQNSFKGMARNATEETKEEREERELRQMNVGNQNE